MTRLPPNELLAIAHIARAHGIRGEVSAIALAPPVLDPVELLLDRVLKLRDPRGKLRDARAESVRMHQGRWLVKFEGIDSMTDAETLRALDICLTRAELPPLPPDWYWETDLQECRVVDATLGELGQAAGLETSGAQPQLKLRRPNGQVILLPWVKAFLREVDLEAAVIRLELPPGIPGLSDEPEA